MIPSGEQTLRRLSLVVERKTFHLELCENARGAFLRVVEEAAGRRNSVIIPAVGLSDFHAALGRLLKPSGETRSAA